MDNDDLELFVWNCNPARFLNCGVPAPECLVLGSMFLGSTLDLGSREVLEPFRVPGAQVEDPWTRLGSGRPFTFIEAGVEGVEVPRVGYCPLKLEKK